MKLEGLLRAQKVVVKITSYNFISIELVEKIKNYSYQKVEYRCGEEASIGGQDVCKQVTIWNDQLWDRFWLCVTNQFRRGVKCLDTYRSHDQCNIK